MSATLYERAECRAMLVTGAIHKFFHVILHTYMCTCCVVLLHIVYYMYPLLSKTVILHAHIPAGVWLCGSLAFTGELLLELSRCQAR